MTACACDGDVGASVCHATPVATPDVSIVIVSWNTCERTRACLESINFHRCTLSVEVIVVDNGSDDGTVEVIHSSFPGVELIQNPVNRGFSVGTNQGLRVAHGRYVLLLNSDTVLLDDVLDNTVAFADRNADVGAVGCRVVNPDGSLQCSCMTYPGLLNLAISGLFLSKLFPRSRLFGREAMSWWDYDAVQDVDVVMGCFMLVRRAVLNEVGVLDERFFFYGEEVDWCLRMEQARWRRVFVPFGQIIHDKGASTKRAPVTMVLQNAGSELLYLRKHRSSWYYVAACGLMWLNFASRVVPSLVCTVLVPKRRRLMWLRVEAYALGLVRLPTQGARGLCHRGRSTAVGGGKIAD